MTKSLLVSLSALPFEKVCSYLDPSDLCHIDVTCSALRSASIPTWKKQSDCIVEGGSEASSAKARVLRFLGASKMAKKMQELCRTHSFDEVMESRFHRCMQCDDFPDSLDLRPRDYPDEYEYFCRVARRSKPHRLTGLSKEKFLIWEGFLKRNNTTGILELEEGIEFQNWEQLDEMTNALTHAYNNRIPVFRMDNISSLKLAALSNLSATIIAVPRSDTYRTPTLMVGAHRFWNTRSMYSGREVQVYFEEEQVSPHSPIHGDTASLYVSIIYKPLKADDQPRARFNGFGFDETVEESNATMDTE
mmetsp:Transcript_13036/g.21557  ORF Transcript_13036/g.21557 Transcript_13036/m.21557 type:complete len:304 (-) Transcript_13036:95-1006(-)|eukprot:CAMPEP_0119014852 /NCGR_PEP_ID=MMETSP1176-20130426/10421_1 /TAXON_ID=265551 /ORGANISM="Synedropsis recta cf, Strain CCMP1620" /LENGTH=303 /DNA_ID=CAMNT_0006968097 /DNA_START=123 /DNA_END=1034 /DNA_ORIENTATION=-